MPWGGCCCARRTGWRSRRRAASRRARVAARPPAAWESAAASRAAVAAAEATQIIARAPTWADDVCKNCGKKGNWAKDCRGKPKGNQAQMAQDDEPTLLLLQAGVDSTDDASPKILPAPTPSAASEGAATPAALLVDAPAAVVNLVEEKVFATLDGEEDKDPRRWVLDSGAINHMTGSQAAFSDIRIEGCGTVLFACKNGEHHALDNIYYIPRLTSHIISVGQLDECGYQVLIEDGVMRIRDEQRRLLVKVHRIPSRLYVLDINLARPVCLAAQAGEDAWRWHARFGHTNFTALRKMGRELVRRLPLLDQVDQVCEACLAIKQRRGPIPQKALHRATTQLERVYGDLCGPISPSTPSGNSYFLLVDDYSRFMWVALLPTKDGAAAAIKRIQAAAELEIGNKLRVLCTDRGGEFTASSLNDYCTELGVHRELTAPYSPQQNEVIERRNQTVVTMARSMLKAKNLPSKFGGRRSALPSTSSTGPRAKASTARPPSSSGMGERQLCTIFEPWAESSMSSELHRTRRNWMTGASP
ncbi:hypothetical protein C2845_PM18G06050 [Panicum miliaceum]|uniref:Integrase catalytic domain-containing protein n=1 Tax=Panicum miliaceum TaxID=4540 RepID=A0A3L6PKH5_PANMI|nr:hypothetical protein C2845_PM18G06050 [Panicum miliaceum]